MENQYYYNEIMNIYGMDSMKQVIRKWHNVSKYIVDNRTMPIVLPNLLWITKPGIGKTYFMGLLSEYLASTKLMPFYGNVKALEFSMDYCSNNQDFTELRRLFKELDAATGFRGRDKGLLSIELYQWIDQFDSKHFHQLMAFLSSRDNDLCILFILENVKEEVVQPLENILAQYVRIEKVISEYPLTEELLAFVVDWLGRYDFELTSGAYKLLQESIAQLRGTECFDGFKTLNLMCEDIVFEILANDNFNQDRIIKEDTLRLYAKDGMFITRLKDIMEKRQIGFISQSGGAL